MESQKMNGATVTTVVLLNIRRGCDDFIHPTAT
jgi:hypothetical protein